MAGYRELPMGRHDLPTMSDARSVAAFEKFVKAKQELLAVALQGRGVFTISTRIDGPKVTSTTPPTPVNQALTQATVTFNEAVDIRTFTVNANTVARNTLVAALVSGSISKRRAQIVRWECRQFWDLR